MSHLTFGDLLIFLLIFLDFPNCEIELDLVWSEDCMIFVLLSHAEVLADPAANSPIAHLPEGFTTSATFEIITAKLYVQTIENIKQVFKRTISCNKYRSEITTQPKNNNFDYMIDPIIRNINGLLVLSFKNGNNDPKRNSFDKYYMPLVEIKDFNALIDNKQFLIKPYYKLIGIDLS